MKILFDKAVILRVIEGRSKIISVAIQSDFPVKKHLSLGGVFFPPPGYSSAKRVNILPQRHSSFQPS